MHFPLSYHVLLLLTSSMFSLKGMSIKKMHESDELLLLHLNLQSYILKYPSYPQQSSLDVCSGSPENLSLENTTPCWSWQPPGMAPLSAPGFDVLLILPVVAPSISSFQSYTWRASPTLLTTHPFLLILFTLFIYNG